MSKTYISASLRRIVGDRANGCCEYCLIPEALSLSSHQVDHVIAEKHGGDTVELIEIIETQAAEIAKTLFTLKTSGFRKDIA